MNKELEKIVKKIPDDPTFIPDFDLYRQTFFAVNPDGNMQDAYDYLLMYLNNDEQIKKNVEGTGDITYLYLIKKYDNYISWWKNKYSDQEERFIKKDEKLKNPQSWITNNSFNEIYSVKNSITNDYIYGGFSMDALRNKLEIFKQLIGESDGRQNTEVHKETQPESYRSANGDDNSDIF